MFYLHIYLKKIMQASYNFRELGKALNLSYNKMLWTQIYEFLSFCHWNTIL